MELTSELTFLKAIRRSTKKNSNRTFFTCRPLRTRMGESLDLAWTFLKSIDFSDVGPMPTRYKIHPDNVKYEEQAPPSKREEDMHGAMWMEAPKMEQERMEGNYIPDLQQMLELATLRQASGGQQVPLNLLRDPNIDEWYGQPYHEMFNLPQGGTPNLPLPD